MRILDIIRSCGGARAIAKATVAAGVPVTINAVYKWQTSGIPDRHWATLIKLNAKLTEADLFRSNEAVRRAGPLVGEHVAA